MRLPYHNYSYVEQMKFGVCKGVYIEAAFVGCYAALICFGYRRFGSAKQTKTCTNATLYLHFLCKSINIRRNEKF
jgi:hypothetical protein